jgi:orotidine 5'-phosphate decarboxylase subfamily 2
LKFLEKLDRAVRKNNSLLCVGLDVDLKDKPPTLANIYNFNCDIINATKELVCAYKPNSAFYERYGLEGLSALQQTIELIESIGIPVILDAKRGDIGHSSAAYAEAAFKVYKADAVTVNPYLGYDSLEPFIKYEDKGVIVLCLTSNPGAKDFEAGIYKNVARKVKEWNKFGNMGLVVGATKPEELKEIGEIAGDMPILIPGVGAQGGDLKAAVQYGGQRPIINASRSIIFAKDPQAEARKLRDALNEHRNG